MLSCDIHEIGRTIGDGFFAEKITQTLYKPGEISREDEDNLKKAKIFMEFVEKGLEQTVEAKIGYQSLESISSYNRASYAMNIKITDEKEFKTEFKKRILHLKSEIDNIISNKTINTTKVQDLRNFFLEISKLSLEFTQNKFEERQELQKRIQTL